MEGFFSCVVGFFALAADPRVFALRRVGNLGLWIFTLFQVGGFHIQSFEQPWSQPILTLVERPSIDHGLLRKHVTLHPHHRQLIESYLSPCLPQNCSIEIDYSPKAADNHGRRYCCTIGGQRLPRAARLLLFGRNHCEIDLKGSFL